MSTPKLASSLLLLALGSWASAQSPTVESLPNAFRDLSGSQGAVSLPVENRDEGGVPILIGFDFTFYGQTYSQVTVATNGYLTFGTAIAPLNEPIPSDFPPNTILAPFWDDLDLRPNPDAKLLFERYGAAPNRVLTIQWQEVAFKADPAARLSFQVLLFEGTNEVQFHYGVMKNGDGSEGVGLASGSSATIGVEAGNGLEGLELAYDQAGVIDSFVRGFAFQPAGYSVPQGRVLGDLDGDGRITVLDQSRLAELGNVRYAPGTAAELILSDVAPVASDATTLWGDQDLNAFDRDVLTDVILKRRALNPYLSGVSPLSQTPGASVTLVGSAFDPVAANNLVSFSGVGGARVTVPAETVDAAGSQLTVTVPATARRGLVFVTARGLRTNPRVFGVSGIPAILELEPAVGVVGAEVAIVGLEFPLAVGDTTVTIGGQVAAVTTILAGPQPGQTTILATVPALAPGVHAVTVASPAAVSEPVDHPFGDLPVAQLTLPSEGDEVRTLVDVLGTASDPSDFASYELALAPQSTGEFRVVHSSSAPVSSGALGTLNPVGLINGYYTLRLRVTDALGLTAEDRVGISVQGNYKLGVFAITFQDLELPASGIAIRVQREYDSRRKTRGDFGHGWELRLVSVEIDEDPVGRHVTLKNPVHTNGRIEYEFTPVALDAFNVRFTADFTPADAGERSELDFEPPELVARDAIIRQDGVGNWFWEAYGLPFDPDVYLITQLDGTVLRVDDDEDLLQVTKPTGVTLTVTPGGLIHSGGRSVLFERDVLGRIVKVTDAEGNAQTYSYDARGDLVAHRDAEGQLTTFSYLDDHYLDEWTGAGGNLIAKNEYDESGLLIASIDAAGVRMEFEHDFAGRREITRDRLGQATITEYDVFGRVTRVIGADGLSERYVLNALGQIEERLDRRGNTWRIEHDALGNETATVDPEGNRIEYGYDARGNLVRVRDADGGLWLSTYDLQNNLTRLEDPAGGVTLRTYDEDGNVLTQTEPNGDVTTLSYSRDGDLGRRVDPTGKVTLYGYDLNGSVVSKIEVVEVPGQPSVRVETRYGYDKNRLRTRVDYADGTFVGRKYGAGAKEVERVDSGGRKLVLSYDDLGRLAQRIKGDGSAETRDYDKNGNLIAVGDARGRRTAEVNPRGQPTKLSYADGGELRNEYDAAGNLVVQIDPEGRRWEYEYDRANRKVRELDPTGGEWVWTYDGRGNETSERDPEGRLTRYEYDGVGRRTRTVLPDGSEEVLARDSAGRVLSKTDVFGRTTTYQYGTYDDQLRRDSALGFTQFSYDSRGNRLTQTDLRGNTVRFSYDPLNGRRTSKTLPLGQVETYRYEGGNLAARVDFNGNETTYKHDGAGNLVFRTFADGSGERWTYSGDGERVERAEDRYGELLFAYDALGRLLGRAQDGVEVVYGLDKNGRVEGIETPAGTWGYGYDGVGRVTSMTDPQGRVTTLSYTPAGRPERIVRPNGVVTSYGFDAVGRLTRLEHRDGGGSGAVVAGYTYGYDLNGNRASVSEDSGRVVTYGYDSFARLTSETVAFGGSSTLVEYGYDAAGNRTGKATTRGDGSTETVVYVYDANDRLLSEAVLDSVAGASTVSYAYDANGNTLSRVSAGEVVGYEYDLRDRLVRVVTDRGGVVSEVRYRYDVYDNRVATVKDGVVTTHVIDQNRPWAQVIADLDQDGNVVASYGNGELFPVSQADAGGDVEYLLPDGQLSVRTVVDGSGAVVGRVDYDAFGVVLGRSGVASEVGYAGERVDLGTGLVYLRSRWLDPRIGRFLSRDGYEGRVEDPTTLHAYGYVEQNPVNHVDPPGTCGWSLLEIVAVDLPMFLMELSLAQGEAQQRLREIGRAKNLQALLQDLNLFLPDSLDLLGSEQDLALAKGILARASRSVREQVGLDVKELPQLPLASRTFLFGSKVAGRMGVELELAGNPQVTAVVVSAEQALARDEQLYGRLRGSVTPPDGSARVQALGVFQEVFGWLQSLAAEGQITNLQIFQPQENARGQQVGLNRPHIAWTVPAVNVRWNLTFADVSSPTVTQVERIARNDPRALACEFRSDVSFPEVVDAIRWNCDFGSPAPFILSLEQQPFGGRTLKKEAIPYRNKRLPLPTGQKLIGEGIVASNGEFYLQRTDLKVEGRGLSWELSRSYRSGVIFPDDPERDLVTTFRLGHGWSLNYDYRLANGGSGNLLEIFDADGRFGDQHRQALDSILSQAPQYNAAPGVFHSVTRFTVGFDAIPFGQTEPRRTAENGYIRRGTNGRLEFFNSRGWLVRIQDRHGNQIQIVRDSDSKIRIVIDDLGRRYLYDYTTYDHHELLTRVYDETGAREVRFDYDPATYDLIAATSPGERTEQYQYSSGYQNPALNHNMTAVVYPEQAITGQPAIVNVYQTEGPANFDFDSVVRQDVGGEVTLQGVDGSVRSVRSGGTSTFSYEDANLFALVSDTDTIASITSHLDARGYTSLYSFNRGGNVRLTTDAEGFVTECRYNADGLKVYGRRPNGQEEFFGYDERSLVPGQRSNLIASVMWPAPGSGLTPVLTEFDYDPFFNQLTRTSETRAFQVLSVKPDPSQDPHQWFEESLDYPFYTSWKVLDYQEGAVPTLPPLLGFAFEFDRDAILAQRSAHGSRWEVSFGHGDVNQDGAVGPGVGVDWGGQGFAGDAVQTVKRRVRVPGGEQVVQSFRHYNSAGQVVLEVDALGNVTRTEFYEGEGYEDGAQPGYPRRVVVDDFAASGFPRATTELPVSAETSFTYDAYGNVRERRDPIGTVYRSAFDPDGLELETVEDANGLGYVTRRGFDRNKRLVRVERVDQGGENVVPGRFFEVRTAYGILDEVVEEGVLLDSRWLVSRHDYDPGVLRVRSTSPEGNQVEWEHDGRMLRVRETRGPGTPEEATQRWEFDGNRNQVAAVLPDGDRVVQEFDGLNRVHRVVQPNGSVETRTYDELDHVIGVRYEGQVGGPTPSGNDEGGNSLLAESTLVLDELYRVVRVEQALFSAAGGVEPNVVTQTEFDALSRVVASVEPDGERHEQRHDGLDRVVESVHALGNRERFGYDANGNVVQTVEVEAGTLGGSRSFVTGVTYDRLNRAVKVVDNAGQETRVEYDSRGNVVRRVDHEGNVKRFVFDMANRKLRDVHELRVGGVGAGALDTSSPWNPDGLVVLAYEWDDDSRLVGVVDDNGNRTASVYDALDRKVLEVLPDGARTEWVYNVDSTVRETTDPNGSVITRSYDVVDRLVAVGVARGPGVVGTTTEGYEYDGLNRVTTCVDDNGGGGGGEGEARTEWDYDSLSRVVAERQNGQEVRSTWAVDSKRLGCVYPGGRTLSWSFDGVDHPRSVSDAGGVVASWEYEGRGTRVVSTAFRNGTGGEVGYDAVRRVTSLQWARGGAAFVDRGYGYNGVDFRTSETRFDDGGQRDDYVYDSLYRVVRTTLDQGGSGGERRGVEEIGYQLDGAGNRRVVAKAAAVGATAAEEAYEVNARNQYTSKAGVARTHDANGNLLQDETFSYGWDYRNRLVSVAVVGSGSGVKARYGWDCKNRRVRKRVFDPASGAVVRDVRFVWDAWRVCEEQDASGVALSTYVYGPRFLDEVCEVERSAVHPLGSGEVFLHQDVRFNVVAVTDAGGNEVERRYYDDYGNAVDAGKLPVVESAVGVELGFQGRRLDAETGLYYYRNRMYDPQTGRFLQTDPMWDAGNVGNPYTFCWSNPTSLFDAQGTFASLVLRTVISTAIKQAVRRVGPLVMQQVTDRLLTDFMERYDLGDFDLQTLLGDGALSQIITMSGDVTNAVAMDVYNAVGETFDNCFLAGTLVETTTRGRIPVEEVQEGDQIAPPPGHEGCTNPRCGRVEQLFRNTTDQVVTITAVTRPRARERRSAGSDQQGGGEDSEPPSVSQTIRCTPGHPFFVEGQGWVFAGDLREGDAFEARGERVVVANVEIEAERAQTFNFEVACHHTYFVAGADRAAGDAPAVLVHNISAFRRIASAQRKSLRKAVRRGRVQNVARARNRLNREIGRGGERELVQRAAGSDFDIIGNQLSVRVGGRRRVIDTLGQNRRTGVIHNLDAKTGRARLSQRQIDLDADIAQGQGVFVGRRTRAQLREYLIGAGHLSAGQRLPRGFSVQDLNRVLGGQTPGFQPGTFRP